MKLQAVAGGIFTKRCMVAIGEDVLICAKIDDFILPC